MLADSAIDDAARRSLLDALAGSGASYRDTVYREGLGIPVELGSAEIGDLLSLALAFVDHTIRTNRRTDGLFHAYNLLEFTEQPAGLKIHRLAPMLEGQVAVLSAGVLSPAEAVALLQALRQGPLYRPDQHSYLLYPDRQLAGFLERNTVAPEAVNACPLLRELLAAGDTRLLLRDASGVFRFNPDLVNGDALESRLQLFSADSRWTDAVQTHRPQVKAIYEQVFHHRAFTGRSGSMFGYEGLGSIYWHMVAKLLVAVQENVFTAQNAGDPAATPLSEIYNDVRAGLGFNKTPSQYGAFPTDPYSHTPGHSGAQQPGMTGQVKEEILTRLGELGVRVTHGCVNFAPTLLGQTEFTRTSTVFTFFDADGREACLPLPEQALAFTFCGVPVIYRRSSGETRLRIQFRNQSTRDIAGNSLTPDLAREVFSRTGQVAQIEVALGADFQPLLPRG